VNINEVKTKLIKAGFEVEEKPFGELPRLIIEVAKHTHIIFWKEQPELYVTSIYHLASQELAEALEKIFKALEVPGEVKEHPVARGVFFLVRDGRAVASIDSFINKSISLELLQSGGSLWNELLSEYNFKL